METIVTIEVSEMEAIDNPIGNLLMDLSSLNRSGNKI